MEVTASPSRWPLLILLCVNASTSQSVCGRQFRRVNGHLHLPGVRAALEAHVTENVTG